MKIKDSELKAILAEVETEIGQLLKSEADKAGVKLAKVDPGEVTTPELQPDESATEPAGDKPAEASAAPADEAPKEEPEAPGAEEKPEQEASGEDPAADESSDPEALKAEYAKLDIEELKTHYMAAKAALFEAMGQGGEGEEASAPPAPAPEMSPPPPPAPMAPPMAAKSEASVKEEKLAKAEKNEELESLKAKLAKTEEAVEKLVSAMTMVVSRPERKAVTNLDFVPKTQEAKPSLSKSEVMEKLNTMTKTAALKKSDRELINAYCSGGASFEKIEHLFADK